MIVVSPRCFHYPPHMSTVLRALVLLSCGPLVAARADDDRAPGALAPAVISSAIAAMETAFDERWSYRHANEPNFDSAFAALRSRSAGGMTQDQLGIELQKILALGIDGHSQVSGYQLPPGGKAPFMIESEGYGFVAFDPDHKAFLAPGFPLVRRIDGVDIEAWCARATILVPKGSAQYVRSRTLRQLQQLDYWRGEMGIATKYTIDVELTDGTGRTRKLVTLPVATSLPAATKWPPGGSRVLEANVGYLRLPTMDRDTSVPEIQGWMPKFRNTIGLIVDVRDNSGGERDALRLLYSYLAAPSDPPRVFTAAAYRLYSEYKENYLAENHFMYRAGAPEWSHDQREAVAKFAKSFQPEWKLPVGQFGDWHYLALTRLDNPEIYHYDKPVIVLLNSRCFSATDIFLAGLRGMPNVRLLGTPSSGGSAYGQTVTLGETSLKLRIGSMASFQADGKLFDRNGIIPDVIVAPNPEYYIGGRDHVLEEAVRRIRNP